MRSTVFLFLFISMLSATAQDYFQQEVNYTINVALDDQTHELYGDISIEYTNNSPDSLAFIYMHMWPNAYKNTKSAMAKQLLEDGETSFLYSEDEDRGYIDGVYFRVNEEEVRWKFDSQNKDICQVYLNTPLKSGSKITISTPFHVKIPKGIYSRLGHMGQSYQITQWYPKPAVYDREGWHTMPYLNQGEFYSEYGTYDVSISLPKNYVVGATGDLVDGKEELKWLNEKVKQTKKKEFGNSGRKGRRETEQYFPPSVDQTKVLRYQQKNVHDFAWFADKRWNVLKGEVTLPHSKRKVQTWAMFLDHEAKYWKNGIEYINDALYYYSLWNGDYPYSQMTAVDGALSAGGGMEYPNVTIIGNSGSAFALETVIMHEVGHNWFYGILGSNERKHAWMDEGINSFNEMRYIRTKYPHRTLFGAHKDSTGKPLKWFDINHRPHDDQYYLGYLYNARINKDQPIELTSKNYTETNYGTIVYMKTAAVFNYLYGYLGEELFDQCMRAYFEKWKFKHPQPNDLQEVLEKTSGKNLSWLFDDLIKTTKKLDYAILKAKNENNKVDITIKNTGQIPGPVSVSGIKNGEVITTVWSDGFEGKGIISLPQGDYDVYKIDGEEQMPEINRKNNALKTTGIFKRLEKLRFQLFGSLENPDRTQIFWSPLVGWNNQNKWMFGAAIYNSLQPRNRFEYVLAPLYSFSTNSINGYANAHYNIYPNQLFEKISIGVDVSKFNNSNEDDIPHYIKIAPKIEVTLKKKTARSQYNQVFTFRHLQIQKNCPGSIPLGRNSTAFNCTYTPSQHWVYYNDLTYRVTNNNTLMPWYITANLQQGDYFMKASAEAGAFITYNRKGRGFDLRVFVGSFLYNDSNNPNIKWRMSGQGHRQRINYEHPDYTYDHTVFARGATDGILSQQFLDNHGAFKAPYGPSSDTWMAAINLKWELPIPIPIGIFADLGAHYVEDELLSGKRYGALHFNYDFGLYAWIARGVFEVYFPMPLYSNDIKNAYNLNGIEYIETIRFMLNLDKLSPLKMARNFQL